MRKATRAARALRAVAAELIEPEIEIDAVAAEPAFGENSGNFGGLFARAQTMRIHDHPRQPGRQRQRTQALAFRGDAAIGIERAEFAQETARLLQRGRRRRVEKCQRAGIADTPLREVEHQRRKIGAQDFGLGVGCKRRGLRLVPQPIANTGLGAAGAATALVNRGA